jgi:crotonobetainyl-CoA:carnitine CoA-transferase CaiB-like acyl-CoA transferase
MTAGKDTAGTVTAATAELFAGLRVVDATSGMAGPLASMMLADHGADVVKVEPAGGDWARALPAFVQWNRGKRSVVLDLDAPVGREAMRSLVLGADVLIATDAVSLLERAGLDRAALDRLNPGLVACTISGFGPARPPAGAKAYEGVVAAATGRMTRLDQLSGGQPGQRYDEPAFTAAPVASFGASQLAVHAIVAALLQRETTGRGHEVSTSLLQGASAFIMRQELGRDPEGSSAAVIGPATHRGIELCFLTAECADGRYIQMCARQDRHFRNWLRAVGLEDALAEPRYAHAPMGIPTVADVDELEARLRQRMRTRTQTEWMRVFIEEFDVGADPFLTPAEFLAHADMVANDRVIDIVDPQLGVVRQLGPLVQMSATPARIERSAPRLGEHRPEWLAPRLPLPEAVAVADPGPPLAGFTILEVAYFIAGPLATAILAEMGARVIKVEPLDGDPYRRTGLQAAKFLHGKESLTLDLKHPQGRAILDTLLDRADVVVHSFRAAAAARLGLDADTVLRRNPRALHLYAASYGSRGPQRDRAAFHSTPNALTGGGIKQAGEGNPPVNDSYADPGSALGAATAILFGLWGRQRAGLAQTMETTMLASTGYIHSADMVVTDPPQPFPIADHEQRGLCSHYRIYRGSIGHIFVAAVRPHERTALLRVVGRPDLAGAADGDIAAALQEAFAREPATEWARRLAAAGVGVAEVYPEQFDKWLEAQGLLTPAQHPAFGEYWRIGPKVEFAGSPPVLRPPCAAGEHSCDLLSELGFDQQGIDRLIAAGVTSDGRQKPPD